MVSIQACILLDLRPQFLHYCCLTDCRSSLNEQPTLRSTLSRFASSDVSSKTFFLLSILSAYPCASLVHEWIIQNHQWTSLHLIFVLFAEISHGSSSICSWRTCHCDLFKREASSPRTSKIVSIFFPCILLSRYAYLSYQLGIRLHTSDQQAK